MCLMSAASVGLSHKLCQCCQQLTAAYASSAGSTGSACNPGSKRSACNPGINNNSASNWKWRNQLPAKLKTQFNGKSHKDIWYATNRNIIHALCRVLDLHVDVVFDFLYTLTLQNFNSLLNPGGRAWNLCRVPLSQVNVCDTYANIFDLEGNVRNPFDAEVLQQLLLLMQHLLKQDKGSATAAFSLPNESRAAQLTKQLKLANRAGIGPDSLARANGIRRRWKLGKRQQLAGSWREDWSSGMNQGDQLADSLTAARLSELKRLLWSVQQQTGLKSDLQQMLDAVRQLNIKAAVQGEAAQLKRTSQQLSRYYNKATGSNSELNDINNNNNSRVQHISHLNRYGKHKSATIPTEAELEAAPSKHHYYYGAPMPILMHEPFNPNLPRTWIRRHPDSMRLNEKGKVVRGDVLRRYKRQSERQRLSAARRQYSIHSVYSGQDIERSSRVRNSLADDWAG